MSVSDNYSPVKEIGNGTTTEFTGGWPIFNSANLYVYLENVATGTQVLQTLGVDYTLVFTSTGWTVTMTVAPPATEYFLGARDIPKTQATPYKTSSGFQGGVQETSFDKLTAITQDMQDELDRSLKSPVGADPLVMPTYGAGFAIGWSAITNNTLVNSTKTLAEIEAAVDLVNGVTSGSGVLVSSADTTIGFLNTKLVAGNALSFTINNPASVETMDIDVDTATTSSEGVVELATTAEMTAGTANKIPDAAEVKTFVDTEVATKTGITEGTETATTSGTELDFTSIASTAKRITLQFDGLSTSGTSPLIAQLIDDGGVETSGYVSTTFGGTEGNVTRADAFTDGFGFIDPAQMAASATYTGTIVLTRMDGSTKWLATGTISKVGTGGYSQTGTKTLTATLTGVRLTTQGGSDTLDLGSMNITVE